MKMHFNLVTYSDESLQAIASGSNPVMVEQARAILARRTCAVPTVRTDLPKLVPTPATHESIVTLNRENIHALFNCGSPNSRQRNTLGLGWPLKAGWVDRLIGREVSAQLYDELLTCKGRRPRGWPKADWRKAIKDEST